MAKLLEDAKENENSLTKLLDTNNIKYRDRNGEVIKLNQMLTITADLLKRSARCRKRSRPRKMVGLSEEWVNAHERGGAAFNELAARHKPPAR